MSCRLSGTCGSGVITSLMTEIESKLQAVKKREQPTSWNNYNVDFPNPVQIGSKFKVKITASEMADIDVQWEKGVSNNRSLLLSISPVSR
jgi:acyl dehydratase